MDDLKIEKNEEMFIQSIIKLNSIKDLEWSIFQLSSCLRYERGVFEKCGGG